ncbi:hypothetical protein GCM10009554_08460 [Kribbella koreensis]|uniref:Uncharacterized protein n=1 Tax=Kribbella koreensis TaxID=57909 RepID=A0ABP3ZZJ5_9ACTN
MIPAGTAWSPLPNPPATMLPSDRFIALAIKTVRIVPEAPTSAPAVISTVLLSRKPAIATAIPVQAFSSETTTGMSAPPIGSTKVTPRTIAVRYWVGRALSALTGVTPRAAGPRRRGGVTRYGCGVR